MTRTRACACGDFTPETKSHRVAANVAAAQPAKHLFAAKRIGQHPQYAGEQHPRERAGHVATADQDVGKRGT